MPHQCTKCGSIFPDAAKELLKGCDCGSRFFYYIRQERLDALEKEQNNPLIELEKADKEQIERDIRELTGLDKEPDKPVVLDLESVRVIEPGKFEIDLVNLFSRSRPIIYKLEEGKYIIDLSSSFKKKESHKKVRMPNFNKLIVRANKEETEDNENDEEDISLINNLPIDKNEKERKA